MARPAAIEPAYAPRGLRRDEAARYVGIGLSKFLDLVKAGSLPAPREIGGCHVWDRLALDAAFDDLPHRGAVAPANETENPWDSAA